MVPHVIDWTQGSPPEVLTGMLLHLKNGKMFLVGTKQQIDPRFKEFTLRYTQLVKDWEIEWVADVTNRNFY
jgi:hypothetical protein